MTNSIAPSRSGTQRGRNDADAGALTGTFLTIDGGTVTVTASTDGTFAVTKNGVPLWGRLSRSELREAIRVNGWTRAAEER